MKFLLIIALFVLLTTTVSCKSLGCNKDCEEQRRSSDKQYNIWRY